MCRTESQIFQFGSYRSVQSGARWLRWACDRQQHKPPADDSRHYERTGSVHNDREYSDRLDNKRPREFDRGFWNHYFIRIEYAS